MRIAGWLAAAVPVVFGVIRAVTTGNDLRYLWIAMWSSFGAGALAMLSRSRPETARFIISIVFAAAGSGVAAYGLGARNVVSTTIVCLGFALCSGVGLTLALPGQKV